MRANLPRGILLIVVTLGLGIWAGRYAGTSPANERRVPPAPAASPSQPTTTAQPGPSAGAQPAAKGGQPPSAALRDDDPSPTQHGLTVKQAREREAMIAQARARDALNTELHARNTAAWDAETRDPVWAKPIEDDIRRLLVDSGLDHLLVDISCRRTMCMLEADIFGAHADLQRLQDAPGLLEALGGDGVSSGLLTAEPEAPRRFVLLGAPPPRPQ